MVTDKVMTPQCWGSVVQVLVVRVDIGMVIYEAMTSQCGRSISTGPGCQIGYRSDDLSSYNTPVWEVSGSGPGCQSGYRSGDL